MWFFFVEPMANYHAFTDMTSRNWDSKTDQTFPIGL